MATQFQSHWSFEGGVTHPEMTGLDKKLILPDGRKLCHAEYENPDGSPVLYFHGSSSSCLEPASPA
jgi:hypothetical protein